MPSKTVLIIENSEAFVAEDDDDVTSCWRISGGNRFVSQCCWFSCWRNDEEVSLLARLRGSIDVPAVTWNISVENTLDTKTTKKQEKKKKWEGGWKGENCLKTLFIYFFRLSCFGWYCLTLFFRLKRKKLLWKNVKKKKKSIYIWREKEKIRIFFFSCSYLPLSPLYLLKALPDAMGRSFGSRSPGRTSWSIACSCFSVVFLPAFRTFSIFELPNISSCSSFFSSAASSSSSRCAVANSAHRGHPCPRTVLRSGDIW